MDYEKILEDHEILSTIINTLGMKKDEFAEALGYKNKQSVYNITTAGYNRKIPSLMRNNILKKYPVNWKYLDYGIKPVLLTPEEAINQRNFLGLGDSKGVIQLTPGPSEMENLKKEIFDLKEENRDIKADIRELKEALRQLRK